MLQVGNTAPRFSLNELDKPGNPLPLGRRATLLAFIETDCPTCRLALPYLNDLARRLDGIDAAVIGISQDGEEPTRALLEDLGISFPVAIDVGLEVSRMFDPQAVPSLFLLDHNNQVVLTEIGFDKSELNAISAWMGKAAGIGAIEIAGRFDGAPDRKPGCRSRHLEAPVEGELAASPNLSIRRGERASRVELADDQDPYEYCQQAGFGDPLPVIPPTLARVERMLAAAPQPPEEIIGFIPPNYAPATVEKIAANAVMAGCAPEMMTVLLPLVRAVCDEAFNIHGIQATTHFAAPLIIVNGPIRSRLGFASGGNVFSNVSRANSSLGRALQLILTNLGGARPAEIDMSTLGNPGKFSYCIAENEEASPWDPFHGEMGFDPLQSTVSLFGAEPPKGVSEHNARKGAHILKAITRVLATSWTYLFCGMAEAIVVLCPEHVATLHRDGFSKAGVRDFLFENTGIPLKEYSEAGPEGVQYTKFYEEVSIGGERCYRKFRSPESIRIIVAGGPAGKFSAVISSWSTGPRGSQMVTYPIA